MIRRLLSSTLVEELHEFPAVALLGPRQAGKTTLALEVAEVSPSIYLDMESERDRAKLVEAELYLETHTDKLVILDEIHRAPGLFPILRGLIDRARRGGARSGLYLLLGSASLDLLRQSGETLAGRISYLELCSLGITEVGAKETEALWLRGGFPDSFLAPSDARSFRWREHFVRAYLERDVPQFGPRIASETLRRLWTMLAHQQGGLLNASAFARSLGIDIKTVQSYIELLCSLLLVRRLQPWSANTGKRLVKSPKVYVRDSGIVHALLDVQTKEVLLSHPVLGASWEGFVIENVLTSAGAKVQPFFFRTSAGAEIDLLLVWPDGEKWAIEIKRSLSPKVDRGFYSACEDLTPSRKFLVYPGEETFPVGPDLPVVSLHTMCLEVAQVAQGAGGG